MQAKDTSVVGYVRCSTDDQENGFSLEAQERTIRDYCERSELTLLRVERDVLSGKNLTRPGLQAALGACRLGEASGIVVAKLDRLSRSVIDFAGLLQQAQKQRWNIVALDFGLDLSTPQGELVANVMVSVAQWERRIIGQRTKDALAVKRSNGAQLGRPVDIPDVLAKRIRRMRGRGMSLQAICDKLNSDNVPTARGGSEWRPTSLRAVLR